MFRLWFRFCCLASLAGVSASGEDFWESAPIRYSETAPARSLESRLPFLKEEGFRQQTPLEQVRAILKALQIPESSQILVYSKTSKQNDLIRPGNPRAVYFSPDVYAGYVPGGMMEIAIHDPQLGMVYEVIELGSAATPPRVTRQTGECLSCHGTARTSDVPGVLVRSVFPDHDGRPIGAFGSGLVTSSTPLAERWGGYYVTGNSSMPHLGNRVYEEGTSLPNAETSHLSNVAERITASRYPRTTSDVVALLTLEHQCDLHNRLTAASMRYRRNAWMGKLLDPASDPDLGNAGRLADEDAKTIVDALLFKDEASLGDGVEGDETFQNDWTSRFPKTSAGESLGDFHLGKRLFKYRCSYMVYSQAFQELPPRVRSAILKRLRTVLTSTEADEACSGMKEAERLRIDRILRETLPAYAAQS